MVCGVRGERYRARLFHVLNRDRDGLGVVDGGGRDAGAIPPVVHLDGDAVAGLRLEVQGLARLRNWPVLVMVKEAASGPLSE